MIPLLYKKDGTTKIGELTNCIECLVEEERNGLFEVSLIYPTTDSLFNSLEEENIIVCNANDTLLNQKFRIYMTRKLMSNRIEVFARHISFDLAYDTIDSIDITNQSCEYALNTIFRQSQFSTHYRGYSDIVNAQDYKISMCNCIEAIAGKEGSIIDTFGTGAELLRDNEDIYVINKRGHDNSVSIEYAKNLTGFELEEDTTDLITRIMPYAKYNNSETNKEVLVKANAVDSPLINNYSHPYIAYIDYSDKFEDGEEVTIDKLVTFAENEYRDNKVDIPKQNYKIEFIPLSKCVGYEGLEDKISICDTVTIKDTRYNIDTKAKVIRTVFDVLKNRYESMELGEPRTTLGDIIGGSGEDGKPGPPGPQGPPGADGNIGDFPDSLPSTPVLSAKLYGFASIELSWTFENKVYYQYELYASKTNNFTPNAFDLIHAGQSSSFLFQAKPNETWHFRVCAVNSHGNRTSFSDQVSVTTTKIDDLSNYVDNMAIGEALIGTLSLDRGWIGKLNASYLDVKGNFSVTDGNGKRTLDIDSFGNVYLDVTSFSLKSTPINNVISSTANTVFNNKTQLDIFNKLTNNGVEQGIYLQDGKLYINGKYLKSDSISASSVNIGDYNNYVVLEPNATFTGTSGLTEGYEICSIWGSEKYNHANLSNKLYEINGGDKFRIKAFIKCDTAGSRLDITCCWRNANNEIISSSSIYTVVTGANEWTEINDIITVPSRPSGASYVRFKINIQSEQSRRIYVERLNITRMYSGELIVDGSITSKSLSVDALDGRTIKGAIIVGGELRGSSNFFTSPDPSSVDGYAFRIYSTGELHSNNLILTSIGNNYSRLESSGVISCSKQVNSPAIITGGQSLWLGIRGVTPGSESNFNLEFTQQADKNCYFRPGYNGQTILGHPAKMFNNVFSVNGTSSSSDRTLKENIRYLSDSANPNCATSNDITEEDLYNFVKDDLITATFNFIGNKDKHIGFIAQDLLYNVDGTDNRVGQLIVNKPDDERSPLSYNEKIYTNVLGGALRCNINNFEAYKKYNDERVLMLEQKIEKLENIINSIVS